MLLKGKSTFIKSLKKTSKDVRLSWKFTNKTPNRITPSFTQYKNFQKQANWKKIVLVTSLDFNHKTYSTNKKQHPSGEDPEHQPNQRA